MRSDDPSIIQEPHLYRMTEVCAHYGDSIMSAIDFTLDMERVTGSQGEARCKVTLNASGWSTGQSDRFSLRQ